MSNHPSPTLAEPPLQPGEACGNPAPPADFFARHEHQLRRLLLALGRPIAPSADPARFAAYALPRWLGTEHGDLGVKDRFTPRQCRDARAVLDELGLTAAVLPARRRYDEILVLGASAAGIQRRLALVDDLGLTADVLTVLAGTRAHLGADGAGRDGGAADLMAADGRFPAASGWRPPDRLREESLRLMAEGYDDHQAARRLFPTETDLAVLLIGKRWPRASRPEGGHHEVADHPSSVRFIELGATTAFARVRVLDGRPVERPNGPRRPTTASTLAEWFGAHDRSDAIPRRLLLVTSQPHLQRVRLTLDRLLDTTAGPRPDAEVCACAAPVDLGVHALLGEVAARVALDLG